MNATWADYLATPAAVVAWDLKFVQIEAEIVEAKQRAAQRG